MSDEVHVWREGGILEVTLDRPKANAIDLATSRVMARSSSSSAMTRSCWSRSCGPPETSSSRAGWDLKAAADGDAVDGDYGVGGSAASRGCPGSTNR